MSREAIYSALFEKLKAVTGLKTSSRKLKHWSDVEKSRQPALFQAQKTQQVIHQTGLNAKKVLAADIYLYLNDSSADGPSAKLNQLLDAVEEVLTPDNPIKNTCTLGGLVEYCRIEGTIETDEGTLGEQAVAIIPIMILAT